MGSSRRAAPFISVYAFLESENSRQARPGRRRRHNELQMEIDDRVVQLLACTNDAIDLRSVWRSRASITISKRIGDQAVNIARARCDILSPPARQTLR